MSKIDEAKEQLGELFLMGFSGTELADDTAAFLSQARIGGVVLFAANYENPEQLATLINQVQECRAGEAPLWITVDHEGGKVQRFKEGFTRLPEAGTIAKKGSPKLLFELSEFVAAELKAVGVNVNFAPVADINSNPQNPVIGMRAYGEDEDSVSKMVSAFVRGHLHQGVQPCVKHFPGHGDTTTDSHFALPKVTDSLDALRAREFRPFTKAFKSGCRWVMTAHVLNPNLDPKFPATLSKRVLTDILRDEMRYTGLVVSDDMEMKAVTDHFGAEEAPRLAIEAGCDLLIYRSEAAGRHAYASLLKALDEDRLDPERVLESAELSRELKQEFLVPYGPIDAKSAAKKTGLPETTAWLKSSFGL
ncbi:MAG: beta-N-acetylhexosaminidase [Bdellovibrionales bacterium]|nr:beta-N-acetylhexosaminidase [Bdellovibrionales bacterium]